MVVLSASVALAIIAGALVVFVAKMMANRHHVRMLQAAGAVSQILNDTHDEDIKDI
jgi:hypothetical protein